MAICDGAGQPLGFSLHGADKHETQCVEDVLESTAVHQLPCRLLGDKAYDSQSLQQAVALNWGLELHAPLRKRNRQILEIVDKKVLEGKQNRWKIERFFSWLKSFRRVNVHWDYHPENFLSWIFLAASMILFFKF